MILLKFYFSSINVGLGEKNPFNETFRKIQQKNTPYCTAIYFSIELRISDNNSIALPSVIMINVV